MATIMGDPEYSDRDVEYDLMQRETVAFLLAEISHHQISWAIKSKTSGGGYILTIEYEERIVSDISLNIAELKLTYNNYVLEYSRNLKGLLAFLVQINLFPDIYQDRKSVF